MRNAIAERLGILLLLCVVGSITVGLQTWVGDSTIYSRALEERRDELHKAILANKPPRGDSWGAAGALSLNVRVGVVYLAEGVQKATDLSVGRVYKLIDTIFLFAALVGLFFYLKEWIPNTYAAIGLLYFSAMLPLSYFFHVFQPWDRLQLAIWILALYLVRIRRPVLLGGLLALSMVVKFDTILVPVFYFLVHFSRAGWPRVLLETAALFAVAVGTYLALGWFFPAPMDASRFTYEWALSQVERNLADLRTMHVTFPPLLVHTAPFLLALTGVRKRERYLWASVLFAAALSVVWFTFTVYQEVRAQLVVLVLVLPAALLQLRSLLERRERSQEPTSHA